MKSKLLLVLPVLVLVLYACNQPIASTDAQPSSEPPPTPYPDTPAPVAINVPIVEAPSLITIQFLNELDGWGVTETQIVRTNDGGITWYNVTPTELTETGYRVRPFFLNTTHAWVQVADYDKYPDHGYLYRTSDGGITWSKNDDPFSDGNLNFLDESNGWVLSDLGAGAGSQGVAVFQTTNGGVDWTRTYTNDPNQPGAGDTLPLGGFKSGLTPLNMKTAWVTGVTYSDGTVYVFRTDDGGVTWSQISSLTPPPEALTTQIGFDNLTVVSTTNAFLTVSIPTDINRMAVYISKDSGNSWSLTPTLIPNGGSADFLSATDAVIYNGEQFYVTRDAAQTWNIIPPNIVFGDMFAMMDFVNASTGWVITLDPSNHRSLYRTTDGGKNWSPIVP